MRKRKQRLPPAPPAHVKSCGRLKCRRLAQAARATRRTELQQARLSLGSLRRPLRRTDRGRAVASPHREGRGRAGLEHHRITEAGRRALVQWLKVGGTSNAQRN